MSTTAVNVQSGSIFAIFETTLGKKMMMALTGFVLFGFVLGHMAGNLQAFLGAEVFNAYAHKLHSLGPLLWVIRLFLLAAVGLHILSAVQLWQLSNKARAAKYVKKKNVNSTYASRTMYWSGPILAIFIVYHILHFTTGTVHPTQPFPGYEMAYQNLVIGFQNYAVAIFYIIAMILLCMHLYHGVWSMLQTLGVSHPKYNGLLRSGAIAFALLIAAGFISVPVSVMAGIIQ
jgi:succinate dehydrogenase / fumarate reductase cytochrome b subunit